MGGCRPANGRPHRTQWLTRTTPLGTPSDG
jgi:hypothetical protein